MHLNPYGRDGVALAVTLANDPPTDRAALLARYEDAGFVDEPAERPEDDDVAMLAVVLERWRAVVDAPEPAERARMLNLLLAEQSAHPRLTDHAGDGWHLHFRDDGLPLVRRVCALVATGTALHLTGRGMHRLGRCACAGCTRIYADFSRAGTQRYCSPACANRDAVRRHRARAPGPRGLSRAGRDAG